MIRRLLFGVMACMLATSAQAQQGTPPFGSFQQDGFDIVNRQNLNFTFTIPIVSSPARGSTFTYGLTYNSVLWKRTAFSTWAPVTLPGGSPTWGWSQNINFGYWYVSYSTETIMCEPTDPWEPWGLRTIYSNFVFVDSAGTPHDVPDIFYVEADPSCGPGGGTYEGHVSGASGVHVSMATGSPVVRLKDGAELNQRKDSNGNYESLVVDSNGAHWKDTTGRVAVRVKGRTDCQYGEQTYPSCIDYFYYSSNGVEQTATRYSKSFDVKTSFGCYGVGEYDQSGKLLPVLLVLGNGKFYKFEYEVNQTDSNKTTARLEKITLPTGGTIEYEYPGSSPYGIDCTNGTVTEFTRTVSDGSSTFSWDFARSGGTTKVKSPALPYDDNVRNEAVYTFTNGRETSAKFYQGTESSGDLLRTVNTTWATNGTPSSATIILGDTNQQSKMETTFDSFGNLTELKEYDWGSGSVGSLVRKTTITYLSTSGYTSRNIRDRVTEIAVRDAANNLRSKTEISYDQGTLTSTSGAPQHDYTGFSSSFTTRGNPTTIKRYVDGSAYLSTTMTYDDLGNVRTITEPGGATTVLDYTDSYSDETNRTSLAYVTKVTKPDPFDDQEVHFRYYYPTGQLERVTDENGNETTFQYSDPMRRLTKVIYPDNGETAVAYNDGTRVVTTTSKRTGSSDLEVVDQYNPLGQLIERNLPGGRTVEITYDPFGRTWQVTNPHTGQSSSTDGQVEIRFDALGRVVKRINQDSQAAVFTYAGNATMVTDESGKKRITQFDALGRLIRVCEVTEGNSLSEAESCGVSVSPFSSEEGYVTVHQYDVLDNITQTTQGSGQQTQTRTATYDRLSRITTGRVAEVSTSSDVVYEYDEDTGLLVFVKDPRGKTCFEYDELGRLIRKRHAGPNDTCSSGTIKAEFEYDSQSLANAIGRLSVEHDGAAGTGTDKTEYEYDSMGRVTKLKRRIDTTTYTTALSYDLLGNLTQISYPTSGEARRVVAYEYNAAGELDKATDTTGTAYDYVSSATYSPLGTLAQLNLGNNVQTILGWNKRGLLASLLTQKDDTTPVEYLKLTYSYYGNGQIQKIEDELDALRTETYTYDDLLRLATARLGDTETTVREYTYRYDRFGNRWHQDLTAGSGFDSEFSFASASNRVTDTGFSYDNSGNQTAIGPGSPTLTYTQENRLTGVSGGPQYVVDAEGRRVQRTYDSVTTDYFYLGATVIAEKTGSAWTDYIFFGGQRIAQNTGTSLSTARFLHTDHLGSTRLCTNSSGSSAGTCDYEPFGEFRGGATSCTVPTSFRFAGMQWDDDTGLYHTWFREYDATQGRWTGVDPLAGSPDDPQTFDRYTYVSNDPVNLIDPFGLEAMCYWEATLVTVRMNGVVIGWFLTNYRITHCDADPGGGPGGGIPNFPPVDLTKLIGEPKKPNPCIDIPPGTPPGVKILDNIMEAEHRSAQVTDTAKKYAWLPFAIPASVYKHARWFEGQVEEYGPWDFKNSKGPQYRAYGNFHYGIVGRAAGFETQVLYRAAGYVQMSTPGYKKAWGTPWGLKAPYGDHPQWHEWVKWGAWWYDNCWRRSSP